jgi:prophage tail gpP-like protein
MDSVELHVDGKKISNFLSYSIEADIYTADDAFSLDLANPEIEVKTGHRCEVYVNGARELTGIIDRVAPGYDKSGKKLRVEGRDLMGLLVDAYVEEFFTAEGMTMKALAERLIRNVPFISRKDIIYQENIVGNLKKKKGKKAGTSESIFGPDWAASSSTHTFAQIEPGKTVFEVLKTYAASRGMMFFSMPDGTFVFGRPKVGGEPVYYFRTLKSDPERNNVLEGNLDDNISKRYSKITVIGQEQGTESMGMDVLTGTGAAATAKYNTKAAAADGAFPFYKPMIATDNNDSRSPELHARMLMEQQKFEGFKITYRVPGHSQFGRNYAINEMAHTEDETLGLNGNYLIYGRTFEMSKQGTFTSLKLGYPGVVA